MTSASCNKEIELIYIHRSACLALQEISLWPTRITKKEDK